MDVVEACNSRVADLRARGQELEVERADLTARQATVNERIAKYNAESKDYFKRKRENDTRSGLNQRDVQEWVARASKFFQSDDFKTASSAGTPAGCEDASIGSLDSLPAAQALRQAYACFRALQASAH